MMLNIINKLFCIHEYGDVDSSGYQRCKKCNKFEYVGKPTCDCIWDVHETIDLQTKWTKTIYKLYVMRCNKCGEMKNHDSRR